MLRAKLFCISDNKTFCGVGLQSGPSADYIVNKSFNMVSSSFPIIKHCVFQQIIKKNGFDSLYVAFSP